MPYTTSYRICCARASSASRHRRSYTYYGYSHYGCTYYGYTHHGVSVQAQLLRSAVLLTKAYPVLTCAPAYSRSATALLNGTQVRLLQSIKERHAALAKLL